MDTKSKLLSAAEQMFDRHGYTATGMDRLTAAAGMSSRTLYKHAGSKALLLTEVLAAREKRFMAGMEVTSVDALFVAVETWLREEGRRGCLFLRSLAETGGDAPEIAGVVLAHKAAFRARLGEIVAAELGPGAHEALTEQILVLFEGAIHAAVYRGPQAAASARAAAAVLLREARA
ncbi:TetR/AcrR family transcriptional regulator [Oceanicella sp. SM1341]|uniref:TetR/AcrR family transcriptional regulator n=1 Tax=Oceanicella sp. SM1341 TaxID=1548889 RepID=UPI000E4A0395|nr:TetR/AcrR family transcriptional regulator [Oceanicella sp. SM1341]